MYCIPSLRVLFRILQYLRACEGQQTRVSETAVRHSAGAVLPQLPAPGESSSGYTLQAARHPNKESHLLRAAKTRSCPKNYENTNRRETHRKPSAWVFVENDARLLFKARIVFYDTMFAVEISRQGPVRILEVAKEEI